MIKYFNEFIKENVEYKGIDILTNLSNFIKRRFKNDSMLFTYWIGKIFNFSKYLLLTKIELSEHLQDVTHAYIILGDKYYDVNGFHTKEDLCKKHDISEYSFKDFTFSAKLDSVEKCLKETELNTKQIEEMKHIIQMYKNKLNQ